MIEYILLLVLTGLIVGGLARLLVPGPDPMGLGTTILLGISAALIAGLLADLVFDRSAGLLLSLVVAVGLVLLVRRRSPRRV